MLNLFISLVLTLGTDASQTLTLPYDDMTRGSDGNPIYVDDHALAEKLPWVKDAGKRLSTCLSNMTVPEILTIQYAPKVTGSHTVETNILHCEQPRGARDLSYKTDGVHEKAFFDRDPDRYLDTDRQIPLDDIVQITHAIIDGGVSFGADVKDPKLAEKKGSLGTLERNGDGFRVRYGDCGCSGRMELHRDTASGIFVVTHTGYDMCI